ncbi:MAG TPA: DUF559 domain-containing protein, partial [Acidimicrobiia bacterium]
GIGVELDGDTHHYGERAERRDRSRENDLGVIGIRVLRFDWHDVTKRPDYVVQTVRMALEPGA